MKNISILTIAPVLALMTVGCSSPIAMQSTEYDDMYYSSSDRTEYVQPATAQTAGQGYESYTTTTEQAVGEGEMLNPEYAGVGGGTVINNYYADDDYYDGRTLSSRNSFRRANYSFIDPYWGSSFMMGGFHPMAMGGFHPMGFNRFGYSRMAMMGMYDPFFYDPFLDPFFRPGLRFSVGMGFGMGGFGMGPYGMWPGRYGMGGFGPYGGFYNGFNQGFYHGMYANNIIRESQFIQPRRVQYGPRDSRGGLSATGVAERGNLNAGRPDRGTLSTSDEQRVRTTETARPARPARGGAVIGTENRGEIRQAGEGAKEALPNRPTRTGYYDSRAGERTTSPERQSIQQQQRQVTPQSGGQRIERSTVPSSRERVQPQRSAPARERVQPQRSAPARQNIEQRSVPSRSYEQRSTTPSYSPQRSMSPPPSRSNSGGGRPVRGGN